MCTKSAEGLQASGLNVRVCAAGFVSVALGAIFMTGAGLFISVFRHHIGPLFVNDLAATREVAAVAPICAGYQIFDGIAGTSSGVLRYLSFMLQVDLHCKVLPRWKSITSSLAYLLVSRPCSVNMETVYNVLHE